MHDDEHRDDRNGDAGRDGAPARCARGGGDRHSRLGRRARLGIAAAALLGLGAALGALATVTTGAIAHGWRDEAHGPIDRERMIERARDKTRWMLARIDASDEQERRVDGVVTQLVDALVPLASAHRENRRELLRGLLGSEVDRGRLETLRQDELRLADAASARVLDAVVEVAAVLTPGQREELLERFAHGRRH